MVKAVEKAVEKVVILIGQVELVAHQVGEEVTIRRQRSKAMNYSLAPPSTYREGIVTWACSEFRNCLNMDIVLMVCFN